MKKRKAKPVFSFRFEPCVKDVLEELMINGDLLLGSGSDMAEFDKTAWLEFALYVLIKKNLKGKIRDTQLNGTVDVFSLFINWSRATRKVEGYIFENGYVFGLSE